jgi:hypothetical protein
MYGPERQVVEGEGPSLFKLLSHTLTSVTEVKKGRSAMRHQDCNQRHAIRVALPAESELMDESLVGEVMKIGLLLKSFPIDLRFKGRGLFNMDNVVRVSEVPDFPSKMWLEHILIHDQWL